MKDHRVQEEPKDPRFYIGVALIGTGALMLLYLILSVVQILKSPTDSNLVQWVLGLVESNELFLSGRFDDQSFELHASEPFQFIFLCILGLIVVRLLTAVFMSFIGHGAKMIGTAKAEAPARRRSRHSNETSA